MFHLWPPAADAKPSALSRIDLQRLFSYPDNLQTPYVRANFVTSANGVTTLDGLSGGLSSSEDLQMFGVLRQLADVILVGAGTARAERYRGARTSGRIRSERRARGQEDIPPIAVVTARADIDPGGPLFADSFVPPVILTVEAAPADRVALLEGAGADVVLVGEQRAEISLLLKALGNRGLNRVVCEGGPRLFGELVVADAIDELCITTAPCLVGGTDALTESPPTEARPMHLVSVLAMSGGLLTQFRRDRSQDEYALMRTTPTVPNPVVAERPASAPRSDSSASAHSTTESGN